MRCRLDGIGVAKSLLAVWAFSLLGGQSCPVNSNTSDPSGDNLSTELDIGGATGSEWSVQYDDELTVSVRQGTRLLSRKSDGRRLVNFGLEFIDILNFCLRPDVLCPQHLLPSVTRVAQSTSGDGRLSIRANRRGPYANAPATPLLLGQLEGQQLNVPLAGGIMPCEIVRGSALLATAETTDDASLSISVLDAGSETDAGGDAAVFDAGAEGGIATGRSEQLHGRITIIYGGDCVTLGGTGAITSDATIEISVGFSASRREP